MASINPTARWLAATASCLAFSWACTLLAAEFEPGTQLSYKGSVNALSPDREKLQAEKSFDVVFAAGETENGRTTWHWHIDENGRGRWPWFERFGQISIDAQGDTTGTGPALLYQRDEGQSAIVLPLPWLFAPHPPTAGLKWSADPWSYEVLAADKLDNRPVWKVQVSNRFGRNRLLSVDRDSPLVVDVQQRLFMGMGEEYELEMRLVGVTKLDAANWQETQRGFQALAELRSAINRPPRTEDPSLSPDELAALSAKLPALQAAVTTPGLLRIVQAARRDTGAQTDRAESIKELAAKQLGRQVEEFELAGLDGGKLALGALKGHVAVLHFWEYRDTPLKEPYGQVGYLDFLNQRRKADGVNVVGIAVDGRLADEESRGAVVRSVRRLRSFMNLGYTIWLDDGKLLKQFGDPRILGADLPLFVVIGPAGKVVHYHVGHYDVDRVEGLRELDAAVAAALKEAMKK
jgi:hypothetical protein